MIQKVQRKREAKDQPEDQRSVRELPICGFHRSKNIAAGDKCKAMSGARWLGEGGPQMTHQECFGCPILCPRRTKGGAFEFLISIPPLAL